MTPGTPTSRALDCMIAGAHKCGTTSLKTYLSAHPDVATHPQLEFTAFIEEGYSERREADELGKLLSAAGDRLALAKHASLYARPFSLDRLREASPACKILLMLRDPVARAQSAFRMESLKGVQQESFDKVMTRAIEMDREGRTDWRVRVYLHFGCYAKWLGEILLRFPEDNVKVVFLEEFEADPADLWKELCLWLGVDATFSPDLSARHNVGADPKSVVLARAIKRLRSERNPVKQAVRRILPEAPYLRLAEMARNANRAERSEEEEEEEEEEGSAAVRDQLRQWFEKDSDELSRRLGRALPW
jgi:hypothetical protein